MQIETQKVDFKDKAKPRIDAKTDHKPGGGDKKVGPLMVLATIPGSNNSFTRQICTAT